MFTSYQAVLDSLLVHLVLQVHQHHRVHLLLVYLAAHLDHLIHQNLALLDVHLLVPGLGIKSIFRYSWRFLN